MTRFSDDRVREETPHNPLARSKRQDDTQVKIGVKELMSQISNLTTESDDVAKLDGSDDPRLKRLLQPVVERNKKSIAIFEQASQLLRDAERFKANAQADVERRVEERVDRVCRHREDAFEEGEKQVSKEQRANYLTWLMSSAKSIVQPVGF